VETTAHMLCCTSRDAIMKRYNFLQQFIQSLHRIGTPTYIADTLHSKLALLLEVHHTPSSQIPSKHYWMGQFNPWIHASTLGSTLPYGTQRRSLRTFSHK
ncbi:MAG: hypothetical protein ACK53Y_05980, partial [bacterium]